MVLNFVTSVSNNYDLTQGSSGGLIEPAAHSGLEPLGIFFIIIYIFGVAFLSLVYYLRGGNWDFEEKQLTILEKFEDYYPLGASIYTVKAIDADGKLDLFKVSRDQYRLFTVEKTFNVKISSDDRICEFSLIAED